MLARIPFVVPLLLEPLSALAQPAPLQLNLGGAVNDRTGDPVRTLFLDTQIAVNALSASGGQPNGLAPLGPDGRLIASGVTRSGTGSTGDVPGMNATTRAGLLRPIAGKFGDLPDTQRDAGAACNGTADDTTALNGLMASLGEITIPAGTCRITADATWPRNRTIRLAPGATISVDAGKTLTIRGRFDAPDRQIFTGAGKVVGMAVNRPVWWGAVGTYGNTVDSQPAFQAASDSARASFLGADPTNPSDGNRPVIELGVGFYCFARPWELYPDAATPIVVEGRGVQNSGTILSPCPAWTGANLINLHGIPTGTNSSWEVSLRNFGMVDSNRQTTACLRTVPEGAGYGLNSGDARPSIFENVNAVGCPLGFDVVNTLQLRWNRVTYSGLTNSGNTGLKLSTAGNDFNANTGEMTFDDVQFDPCPAHNASGCTDTTGVMIRADGVRADGSAQNSIASLVFQGNSIFWASNRGVDAKATNGAFIGDTGFGMLTQFDGYGCAFSSFIADGTGKAKGKTYASNVFDIRFSHVYHTAVTGPACISHIWDATNGAATYNIWDTHGQFVTGTASNTVIYVGNVTDFHIEGNTFKGSGAATPAIQIYGSNGVVTGNIIRHVAGGTAWSSGVKINAGADYIAAYGNVCRGTTAASCVVNNSSGTHVFAPASPMNVGP